MSEGDIRVQKTSYGCTITDTTVAESVAIDLADVRQLIRELQELLPFEFNEINYNTIVSMGDNLVMQHTYAPECPPGCYGQTDECAFK